MGRAWRDDGQAGTQRAVIETGIEGGGAQSLGRDAVAVSFRNALGEAVEAQATQVVGDPSRSQLAGLFPQQWSKMLAYILVGKCSLDEKEQQQDVQESLHARIGETQRRRASDIRGDRSLHILEGGFADEAVVTDALDVEQTSVGRKADLAQFREIFDASADGEVAGVVDGGFGAKRLSLLVVLLDAGLLVVDVQRRDHAVGDDTGAELPRRAAAHLAVEYQAHLAGAADIEVLANHLLEEDASRHRLIEHLGERERSLQDGELVAIAGGAIACRKRMRQASQPFAQQSIDLVRRQLIAQPLHQLGVGTRLHAIVQRLERHPTLGKLALEILVAVDAELGIVGKVGAELHEERPEVFIDAIEIVVIDHRGGFHDPRIGSACVSATATLRAHDPRLLLGLADIEHALTLGEPSQVFLRDVVLALSLLEANQINALVVDELIDVANERFRHRCHRRRRRKTLAAMNPQVAHHGSHRLQMRDVDIQIHPVDRLDLQLHMLTQDFRHRSRYVHRGLRSSTGPRTHRAASSYNQGTSLQARPESTYTTRASRYTSSV